MNEVFNLQAQVIYAAVDNEEPHMAMEAIYQAALITDVNRDSQPNYKPPLIYGEYFHLFSGVHSDLYTPRRGYFPITEERSALARIGYIQAYELGDEFLNVVPHYLGSNIAMIPQTTLSDIMIMMAHDVRERLDLVHEKEAEIRRLEREQEYLEYMRSQGYELLEENPRAQNFFARVRWPNKES